MRNILVIYVLVNKYQWPKDIKDLPGGYIKSLRKILDDKQKTINYSIKLTLTSAPRKTQSESTADWYLFPDQIKLNDVNIKQIEEVIDNLFVKTTKDQIKQNNHLPNFSKEIQFERLNGIWILVCCHNQHDERCGMSFIIAKLSRMLCPEF